MKKIYVGVLGFGVVGQGTVEVLLKRVKEIKNRSNIEIIIKKICDLKIPTKNKLKLDKKVFTNNADDLINDPEISIVVELIGGTGFAKSFIKKALKKNKHVVTANKHLLAMNGNELFDLAKKNNLMLLAEASVCGAIPCLRTLRKSSYPFKISKIKGILNGTANYILSHLQYKGGSFEEVLKTAQKLGYAEQDPTFDIEGIDAAHKIAILSAFAYGAKIDYSAVDVQGISKLLPDDFQFASDMGYKIKLVGCAEKVDKKIYLSMKPTFVKRFSKLGQIDKVVNAILIEGEFSGPILLAGNGAGGLATGTAVVADIVEIASHLCKISLCQSLPFNDLENIKYGDFSDLKRKSVLRVFALDKPGSLAKIANVLAKEKVSINGFYQKPNGESITKPVLLLLDEAPLKSVQKAAKKLAKFSIIKGEPLVLPIDEDD